MPRKTRKQKLRRQAKQEAKRAEHAAALLSPPHVRVYTRGHFIIDGEEFDLPTLNFKT